ncbi:YnbE family lipoprotein [Novosphingobium sp. Gsoil 351]|uniref:YnbE family lipoprotein n=1 Tax=Novosphingobium sp. Gsoil 351 TaxID=2675225 RepID=UPI001E60E6ED|nr:YnbE family lipoprotein [Novosphingobium sp. Gsoil 351]
MITPRLTHRSKAAKIGRMVGETSLWRRVIAVSSMAGAMALSACVSVKAPDKPIVIELNINIRQEVVYRLAEDAKNTIKDNPGIF